MLHWKLTSFDRISLGQFASSKVVWKRPLGGWKSPAMLSRYAHLSPTHFMEGG